MASPVTFPKPEPVFDDTIEAPKDKFLRMFKEQPLVPIGSLLTCCALVAASYQLRKGNKEEFNRALRWRVAFQGLTVAAVVAGSISLGAKAPVPSPPPASTSSTDPSSSSDPQAVSTSSYYSPAKVETVPGRPATNLQQSRADEKKREDSILFRRRIREAEEKDKREKEMVERALMGESAPSKGQSQSSITSTEDRPSTSLFRSWFGSSNNQDSSLGGGNEGASKGPMRDSRGRPIIGQDSRRQ